MTNDHPVATALAGLNVVVGAGLTTATMLGWLDLDGEQVAAIVAFVAAFSMWVGRIISARTVPLPAHEAAVADALYTPTPVESMEGQG